MNCTQSLATFFGLCLYFSFSIATGACIGHTMASAWRDKSIVYTVLATIAAIGIVFAPILRYVLFHQ